MRAAMDQSGPGETPDGFYDCLPLNAGTIHSRSHDRLVKQKRPSIFMNDHSLCS